MDEQQQQFYQIVYVYEVMENMDKLEGHGAYETLAFVTDENIARTVAHSNPKTPGKIIKRPAIYLADGSYYLLVDTNPVKIQATMDEALRVAALSKLTPQERQALGLE